MKNIISALCAMLLTCPVFAQKFAGSWLGLIDVNGTNVRIVFNLKEEGGKLTGTMDSPDQGAKDIACGDITTNGDSISIAVPAVHGRYNGALTSAGNIDGKLSQGPMSMPLLLTRQENKKANNRPQAPEPPYSYISEDVTYTNADKSMTYGATITRPNDEKTHPALLLITGSGQQNRDEEIFGHKPFAVIADYLTKSGYIVLRVDDRGIGKTTGDPSIATTEDFVLDAKASLQYLRNRKEVNKKKTGLLGHSEGGLIAERIAAEDKELDFVVLAAAPGEPIIDLMVTQNNAVLQQQGIPEETRNAYLKFYRNMITAAAKAKNTEALKTDAEKVIAEWRAETPSATVTMLTGITNDSTAAVAAEKISESFGIPWLRQFFKYDPAVYLKKIQAKVLAVNGDKDIQVDATKNLEAIKTGLKNGKAKTYSIVELKGLNHLFQTCTTCTPEEYKELEETISPTALQAIGNWLDKEVRNKN